MGTAKSETDSNAKPKTASKSNAPIYRLKITLCGIRPPIWRRVEVPADVRLDHLHLMFQAAMGWENSHLHSFSIGGRDFGMIHDDFDTALENEAKFRLQQLIPNEQAKFEYVYDFGDNWEHDVVVEKIGPLEPGVKYPRCIDGARACPPEDVGSIWGYENFLQALRDPKHEEHEHFVEWIGGKFDAEAFDVAKTDARLKKFKSFDARYA